MAGGELFEVVEIEGKHGWFAIQDYVGNCFGTYKTREEAQLRCHDWIEYYHADLNREPPETR